MTTAAWERPPVNPQLFKKFTRVSRGKSIALSLSIYLAAIALAWIGGRASGWWLALPAMLLIAGLQNHLLILLHEGAHWLYYPDKKTNDLLTDIFCAIPSLTLVKFYRALHLDHHRNTGLPGKDPEIAFYREQDFQFERRGPAALARMLLLDLTGLNFLRFTRSFLLFLQKKIRDKKLEPFNLRDAALYALIWGGALGLSLHLGFFAELLVFWILPQATFLFFLLKLHGYGEHTGAEGPTEFERTWVHDFNPITNFFIYPIRSGFHLEHHLFPAVPWYNMKAFRAHLLENPEYAARAEKVTVTGFFFGAKTILRSMMLGKGRFIDEVGAQPETPGLKTSRQAKARSAARQEA